MNDTDPVIELNGVTRRYANTAAPAVQDVSFRIERGQFVALLGGSGSGKTTTLKTINRLIEPDSGEVRILGRPADAEPAHLLRRRAVAIVGAICCLFLALQIAGKVLAASRAAAEEEAAHPHPVGGRRARR